MIVCKMMPISWKIGSHPLLPLTIHRHLWLSDVLLSSCSSAIFSQGLPPLFSAILSFSSLRPRQEAMSLGWEGQDCGTLFCHLGWGQVVMKETFFFLLAYRKESKNWMVEASVFRITYVFRFNFSSLNNIKLNHLKLPFLRGKTGQTSTI